jgi:ParB family chromosome partitioning protein
MIATGDQEPSGVHDPVATLSPYLRYLVWAAGRLGVAGKSLAEVAAARPDDLAYRVIQRDAVLAIAEGELTTEAITALESAALVGAPEVRAVAAQVLARRDPKRAADLADRLLSDRAGFDRLTRVGTVNVDETRRSAARKVHYQGVVLPALIDRGDVATLAAVCDDRTLPDTARLGALEGLAAMGREAAEDVLRRLGMRTDEDEELRKAAWRGIRRSKRARRKG